MKKSELRQMIREVLKEELQHTGHLRESISEGIFYITYQDSYGDSFTSYFISDSDIKSQKHWQKDMRHFESLDPDDKTSLVRAEVSLTGEEANIFNAVINKDYNITDNTAWIEADKLLNKLVRANALNELDISYDYYKSGRTYIKY